MAHPLYIHTYVQHDWLLLLHWKCYRKEMNNTRQWIIFYNDTLEQIPHFNYLGSDTTYTLGTDSNSIYRAGKSSDSICVHEVLGSNLCRGTAYPDWGFLQSIEAKADVLPQTGHDRSSPRHFQLIPHLVPYCLTLYNLWHCKRCEIIQQETQYIPWNICFLRINLLCKAQISSRQYLKIELTTA
jgi:hypothetical protein